jgi:hypothetical protein
VGAAQGAMTIDTSGNVQALASHRAPIFYDSNDTGYYTDPASTSKIVKLYIRNGGANGVGWSSGLVMGDDSNYWNFIQDAGVARQRNYGTGGYDWFNSTGGTQLMLLNNSGTLSTSGDMRSTIFYDTDNTGYYLNPASTSYLNVLSCANVVNGAFLGVSNTSQTSGNGISLYNGGGSGQPGYGLMFAGTPTFGTHGSVSGDWATYFTMNDDTSRGWIFRRSGTNVASVSGGGILQTSGYIYSSTYVQSGQSMYSPIFIDSDNTSYYLNPSSTSNLVGLTVANTISGNISGNAATATTAGNVSISNLNTQQVNVTLAGGNWYTIAANAGDRASAKFTITDPTSGLHQAIHFYASAHFGTLTGAKISVLSNTYYSGPPITAIRTMIGSTYDGAMVQVYANSSCTITVSIADNQQVNGWVIKSGVISSSNPGTVSNYGALSTTGAQVDTSGGKSFSVSDDIYIGGRTTQYLGLHTNNYNSYAPTLTGGNASGTWGIAISGNAATATNSSQLGSIAADRFVFGDGANGRSKDKTSGNANTSDSSNSSGFYFGSSTTGMPSSDWWNWLTVAGNSWGGSDGYRWQMAYSFWGDDVRIRRQQSGSWYAWQSLLHSGNYNSYSPTLTGGNASGTWGIAITGNAARATRANGNFYIDDNYGNTVVGVYTSTRLQGVFAMGDAYKLAADGSSASNHYGIAWSHPNHGGTASNLSSHGMLVQQAGTTMAAISTNIWCSGDVIAYSDARVKDNVQVIDNPLERIKKVRGVTFTRTDLDDKEKRHAGVIAQEMREAMPELVSENAKGELSVSYGNTVSLLIECIKEQQTQIDELKQLVKQLTQK